MRATTVAIAVLITLVGCANAHVGTPMELDEQIESCDACENQMFDCSDMCDCAWGGQDIMRCMICNSKCTAKKVRTVLRQVG